LVESAYAAYRADKDEKLLEEIRAIVREELELLKESDNV
jgi:hypothetical protein